MWIEKRILDQINRFKHEVRFIAHTIQHYPHLLFQTVPLLESSLGKLQCNLDDLELAATFDGQTGVSSLNGCGQSRRKKRIDLKQKHHQNNNMSSFTPNRLPGYQTDSDVFSESMTNNSDLTILSNRSTHQSGRLHRLEVDEEQIYIIARNMHLALHTLLINAK